MGANDPDAASRRADAPGSTRLFWGGVFCVLLMVLVLARVLHPDPSGIGTHLQLGLPRCGFLNLTGLPCPACGLTTSFAHMARLQITAAFDAHALGAPLFALTICALPIAATACLRAWPIAETMRRLAVPKLALLLLGLAFVAWIARLAALA